MSTAVVRVPAAVYHRSAYVDRYGHKHPATTVKREGYKKKVRRHRKSRTPKSRRWYHPKLSSGWKKNQSAKVRRALELEARKGNLLSAARAKQALANVTQDEETRVLAQADAAYFYRLHRKEMK